MIQVLYALISKWSFWNVFGLLGWGGAFARPVHHFTLSRCLRAREASVSRHCRGTSFCRAQIPEIFLWFSYCTFNTKVITLGRLRASRLEGCLRTRHAPSQPWFNAVGLGSIGLRMRCCARGRADSKTKSRSGAIIRLGLCYFSAIFFNCSLLLFSFQLWLLELVCNCFPKCMFQWLFSVCVRSFSCGSCSWCVIWIMGWDAVIDSAGHRHCEVCFRHCSQNVFFTSCVRIFSCGSCN